MEGGEPRCGQASTEVFVGVQPRNKERTNGFERYLVGRMNKLGVCLEEEGFGEMGA